MYKYNSLWAGCIMLKEGRKLMDLQTRQRMNTGQQRFTSNEAEHVHLDLMGRHIDASIQGNTKKKQ